MCCCVYYSLFNPFSLKVQPMVQHRFSIRSKYAFGMELQTMNIKATMAHRHDLSLIAHTGYLET